MPTTYPLPFEPQATECGEKAPILGVCRENVELMESLDQKTRGAYFTPDHVVESLLHWALSSEKDRLLDPSCGDGRFISGHRNSVGIEQDPLSACTAITNAPWALVHEGDFFAWASNTRERFECAVGNPPFIRYQMFNGDVRQRALQLCARLGAPFSGLTSSWAPFLAATAGLLQSGGRMAFVVPAEIGHAPYSAPLVDYLVSNFAAVHIVAVREKLFPDLSEDCWLLYAEGYGRRTNEIRFTALPRFQRMVTPPQHFTRIPVEEWRSKWKRRLRPYLLEAEARDLYLGSINDSTCRLGSMARIGIGYVTGANDFFHLRPSEAEFWDIPAAFLHPTVRNGRALPARVLTSSIVDQWHRDDAPVLLLRLPKQGNLPPAIRRYLDSEAGHVARRTFKCRVRDPWYSVPDVQYPDFFLSYMSGTQPELVRNEAGTTCTNSVHSVRITEGISIYDVAEKWDSDFVKLSCELEGHPLGGGMLKLEPREAAEILLPSKKLLAKLNRDAIRDALKTMRRWRHHG